MMLREEQPAPIYTWRRMLVLVLLAGAAILLMWRMFHLHVFNKDFLQVQGDARLLRTVTLAAHRGMITDRFGEPLAVSTPVDSVWANPQELILARESIPRLAKLLQLDLDKLQQLIASRSDREFVYLRRHVSPELAQQVRALDIPGVDLQREYRRYYPSGEVFSHVLGFTNVDDVGQEGLEMAYEEWLRGEPGAKRVIKDGKNRIVEDVESIRAAKPGRDLVLGMDRRIQYLAYRELKAAVQEHKARSGSAVVLDVKTGEVLAMVNQPAYNPNNRKGLRGENFRNRAVTDVFEPGSTIKPFTVAVGLESGLYRPETIIDTTPGRYRVGRKMITDVHNYGVIDVTTVITKSSNIGATKIALAVPAEAMFEAFSGLGFGQVTGSGYPGEAAGMVTDFKRWRELERATLSFGYGLSTTPLQLAQSYAVLAGAGQRLPMTFLRNEEVTYGEQVFRPETTAAVRAMLETVVSPTGTANLASVPGYRVGGKTGTVKSNDVGGYSSDRYIAVFAGMAPMSDPRLVMVVMVNEPRGGKYYGGLVAAPVFGKVMSGALRLLDIPPDNIPLLQTHVPQPGDPA